MGVLIVALVIEGYIISRQWPTDYLTVAILNVGQGEAIYIDTPKHHRLLIDGGATHAILGELSRFVPFYTRFLDAVILTAPEDLRVGGLVDVLNSYRTGTIIIPSGTSSSQLYTQLKDIIVKQQIATSSAERGLALNFGDGVYLTILYPDKNSLASADIGPIMGKLTFGSTSVLLTAGAPAGFEDYVLAQNGTSTLASTIFTTLYDGPKNVPSPNFIEAVSPQWLAVSAKSVFPNDFAIPTLYTFQNDTIVFHCTKEKCVLK